MSILKEFVRRDMEGPQAIVGVVGDAMVDQYFNVKVKKISPEFPIPVMQSDTDFAASFPGGAANVAYQFTHFNAKAKLAAFTDSEAELIYAMHGLDTVHCADLPNESKVPRKRRFYSDDCPTYRWDIEKPDYNLGEKLEPTCFELYHKVQEAAQNFDALILSDYNKGVFKKYLDLLIPEVPISVVDPKTADIERWRGCTVFKPNAAEALSMSPYSDIANTATYLWEKLGCGAVVVTEGSKGVTVCDGPGATGIHEIRPTRSLPAAESVIGAGDCFIAFLTMALTRKMSFRESAEVAWKAGCLYVQNRHNKPLTRRALIDTYDVTLGKFIEDPKVLAKRDYKLVFTNGCFDILHAGHIETLKFARSKGDKLVVAVNSDESVAQLKPGRPIVPLKERMALLASLEFVDYVFSFEDETPLVSIIQSKPDVLVKGAEYKADNIVGHDFVKEVYVAPMVEGLSTTNVIEKIKTL